MHFYRPLNAIRALTFDLDDTLYDNGPVILRTEQLSLEYLQQQHPVFANMQRDDFVQVRNRLRESEPDIYHDVTMWRWHAIVSVLIREGYSRVQAEAGADDAMERFRQLRSDITVPESTHITLRTLAEHFPLVAITNGNAEPGLCGLDPYFTFILRAGPDGRSKPFSDMFSVAARRLGESPEHILHVGDDLITDVLGAIQSGYQACWINDRESSLIRAESCRLLPHLEISRLASLLSLL